MHRKLCGCPVCNVMHYLMDHWAGYVASSDPCDMCEKTGVCPNCDGKSARIDGPFCPLCEGSGTCPQCHGEGVVYG